MTGRASSPGASPGPSPEPSSRQGAAGPASGTEEWHRLHPVTPLVRGGLVLAVVLSVLWSRLRDDLTRLLVGPEAAGSAEPSETLNRLQRMLASPYLPVVLAGALAVVLVLLALLWLSWRMSAYRYTGQLVEVRHGVVFRTHRSTRLDRVQRVDIDRPLLARVFGLARVRVGTASAGGGLDIAYLRRSQALALRDDLLRLVREAKAAPVVPAYLTGPAGPAFVAAPGPAAAETPLLRQSNWRVAAGVFCSGSGVSFVALLMMAGVGVAIRQLVVIAAPLPLAVALAWRMGRLVLVRGNLRLTVLHAHPPSAPAGARQSGALPGPLGPTDALHVEHGMFSQFGRTLPIGRIHAVEVMQPVLWRPFGWWAVRVNVAGVGTKGGRRTPPLSQLLSIGTVDQCRTVLGLLGPVGMGDPADSAGRGYTRSPLRSLLLFVPSPWRHGFRVVDATEADGSDPDDAWRGPLIALRRGMLWRSLALVPAARVQSVAWTQGAVSRRLGLATITVDTVPGTAKTKLRGLDLSDADRAFAQWPAIVDP